METIYKNLQKLIGKDLGFIEEEEVRDIISFILRRNHDKFKPNNKLTDYDFNKLMIKYSTQDCFMFVSQEIKDRQSKIVIEKTPSINEQIRVMIRNLNNLLISLGETPETLAEPLSEEISTKSRQELPAEQQPLSALHKKIIAHSEKTLSSEDVKEILRSS